MQMTSKWLQILDLISKKFSKIMLMMFKGALQSFLVNKQKLSWEFFQRFE